MDDATADALYREPARRALAAFGMAARTVTLVGVSENATYRVMAEDGASYVLRLHRPSYHTLAELQSERQWVRALAEAAIAVPVPVATQHGAEYVTVDIPGTNERRHVGLAVWQDGELLGDLLECEQPVDRIAGWFVGLGDLMAQLHAHAAHWTPPPGFDRHAVDADGFFGEAPFWGRFWDHPVLTAGERHVLLRGRAALHATLLRYGERTDRFSLIHADLHPFNVLVRTDQRVAAIDFDDAGFGWHIYDLAIVLQALHGRADYAGIEHALLAGYRARRSLDEVDLAMLPVFRLVRRLAHVGWLMQRPELGRVPERETIDRLCAHCEAFVPPL